MVSHICNIACYKFFGFCFWKYPGAYTNIVLINSCIHDECRTPARKVTWSVIGVLLQPYNYVITLARALPEKLEENYASFQNL